MSEVGKNMLLLMDVRTMNCLYDGRFILTPLQSNTVRYSLIFEKCHTLHLLKVFLVLNYFENNHSNTFFLLYFL